MPKVKKQVVRKVVSKGQPYVAPYIPATNPFMYTASGPTSLLASQMQALQDAYGFNKAFAARDAAFKANAKESRVRNSYNPPKQEWYEKLADTVVSGAVSALPFLFL
jgi:hypothetical protein